MNTGFSASQRRAHRLAVAHRPALAALPLAATTDALGMTGRTDLGVRDVDLARVVGTAARSGDFDRRMRPLHRHLRHRWDRVAAAMDTGRPLPVVELVQLGELYFVIDGHHRVSVARARRASQIEATVTAVCIVAYACHCLTLRDLPHKAAERGFLDRFPLPDDICTALWLDDPNDWQRLSHAGEAWIRTRPRRPGGEAYDTDTVASWWTAEVVPNAHLCRMNSTNVAADYLCAINQRHETGNARG